LNFDPRDASFTADPYAVYARLRRTHPILRSPELGMTLAFKHRDVVSLLTDRRLGRTMDHTLTRAEVNDRRQRENWQALPAYARYVRVNLLESEGADHARVRRVVGQAMGPRRVRSLARVVARMTDELLAAFQPGEEIDFIVRLAEPLPVRVIADLLGWPGSEVHRLRPWSAAITRLYEADATAADAQAAEQATEEFAEHLNQLAGQRQHAPQNDLISALVASESADQGLTRDEVIATCMMLLNAGHEATVNAAGNGLLALLRHPRELAQLKDQPERTPAAVEEMLRYDAPLHLFHRFVLDDLVLDGTALRRGDKVGLLYGSANRDPEAFPEPDVFCIARAPNRHLAFGAASHFCLGAPLARMELATLFSALLKRFPDIALANDSPTYRPGLVFRGLTALQVNL
jgi:cytochrome P450